jgi:hypothetical protein
MCDCDQVSNGTSQHISLTHLEVVQIERFRCAHHEIDLLGTSIPIRANAKEKDRSTGLHAPNCATG